MQPLDFPLSLQIETTSRCNAKCGFCPHPETSKSEPQGVMEESLFRAVVDEVSEYPVSMLQPFLNNDPLMDKQILPRTEYIIRKNPLARVSITTNGALLSPKLAEGFAALPLHTIHISSNGLTARAYRDTMQIDGYRVLRNVNCLRDQIARRGSKTRIVVTAILMRNNRDEVLHMKEYWQSRGVDFYLNPLNDRAGNIAPETFKEMLPFKADSNQSQLHYWDMSSCPALYSFMAVLWNGDVVTCCMDWRRAHLMGNAKEKSLREIWTGHRYRAMRALSDAGRLHEMPLCNGCGRNRFAIDSPGLRDELERKQAASSKDLALLGVLDGFRRESPQLIQLGLMR